MTLRNVCPDYGDIVSFDTVEEFLETCAGMGWVIPRLREVEGGFVDAETGALILERQPEPWKPLCPNCQTFQNRLATVASEALDEREAFVRLGRQRDELKRRLAAVERERDTLKARVARLEAEANGR